MTFPVVLTDMAIDPTVIDAGVVEFQLGQAGVSRAHSLKSMLNTMIEANEALDAEVKLFALGLLLGWTQCAAKEQGTLGLVNGFIEAGRRHELKAVAHGQA